MFISLDVAAATFWLLRHSLGVALRIFLSGATAAGNPAYAVVLSILLALRSSKLVKSLYELFHLNSSLMIKERP